MFTHEIYRDGEVGEAFSGCFKNNLKNDKNAQQIMKFNIP
jgi:hypothetical protein